MDQNLSTANMTHQHWQTANYIWIASHIHIALSFNDQYHLESPPLEQTAKIERPNEKKEATKKRRKKRKPASDFSKPHHLLQDTFHRLHCSAGSPIQESAQAALSIF